MNQKYQIYGMGNALVDFEIETDREELASLDIEKGVMTLIEEERQNQLFESLGRRSHARACGGSAANTIIGAQTLGSNCFYSCKVANDETGVFYRDDLISHGVDSNLQNERLPDGLTGKCLVFITPDADRTMNTFLGITGDIDFSQIDKQALGQSEYLYVEGYLAGSPVALEAAVKTMQTARELGVKTAFSLSDPNMVKFCKEGLQAIIGEGVDLLFCNFDEATEYVNCDNLNDAIKSLTSVAKTLVVTLGPDGAVIVSEDGRVDIKGNEVKAIDTNGAGDLFAGSFIHALTNGFSVEQCGNIASFASAQLVTQFGPRLVPQKVKMVKDYIERLEKI
jgi:sugar/nucleoside kinase (ribokinase family)